MFSPMDGCGLQLNLPWNPTCVHLSLCCLSSRGQAADGPPPPRQPPLTFRLGACFMINRKAIAEVRTSTTVNGIEINGITIKVKTNEQKVRIFSCFTISRWWMIVFYSFTLYSGYFQLLITKVWAKNWLYRFLNFHLFIR